MAYNKEYKSEYYLKNKEEILKKAKERYRKNPKKKIQKVLERRFLNHEEYLEYQKNYNKKRNEQGN